MVKLTALDSRGWYSPKLLEQELRDVSLAENLTNGKVLDDNMPVLPLIKDLGVCRVTFGGGDRKRQFSTGIFSGQSSKALTLCYQKYVKHGNFSLNVIEGNGSGSVGTLGVSLSSIPHEPHPQLQGWACPAD